MFKKHDSESLRVLYKAKPWQGQHPEVSKVLIVGQDANYPVMSVSLLDAIKAYHADGVSFWKDHDIHHPFLMTEFAGEVGGIRYHKQFKKLGLDKSYAIYISFVELLDEATYGNTGKGKPGEFVGKVNPEHIANLEKWMLNSGNKLIFVPKMVMSTYLTLVYHKTGKMDWLIKCDKPMVDDEPVLLWSRDGVSIYKYNHFSGAVSNMHISRMSKIIKLFLSDHSINA
jgi:hypothetical protein